AHNCCDLICSGDRHFVIHGAPSTLHCGIVSVSCFRLLVFSAPRQDCLPLTISTYRTGRGVSGDQFAYHSVMAGGRRHECPSRDSGKMEGVSRQRLTALRMIITRSPLRISLGGGGTDLPSYYRKHGGFLISAAIDKYVYITVHRRFVDGFLLKYSKLEEAETIDQIKH